MLPNLPYLVGEKAPAGRPPHASSSRPRCQLRVVALVNHTSACRAALDYARGLLAGRCSELTLVHCLATHHSSDGMQSLLSSLAQGFSVAGFPAARVELFGKADDQTVPEALAELVDRLRPDLVVLGSTALGKSSGAVGSTLASGSNGGRPSTSPYLSLPALLPKHSRHSFALKVCQLLRSVPVLLVKAGSRSRRLSSQLPGMQAPPTKCMVEVQPTSRHMLDWVMEVLDPNRDKLFLAVTKAYECSGARKAASVRLMTAFSVQAGSGQFRPMQKFLKEAPGQSLPRTVVEDQIDLLVVQGPRSKELSPCVVDVLHCSSSSVLIWPPETDRTLASRQSDSGVPTPSLGSPVMPRARAISTDTGFSSVLHGPQDWPPVLAPLMERPPSQQRQQGHVKAVEYKTAKSVHRAVTVGNGGRS